MNLEETPELTLTEMRDRVHFLKELVDHPGWKVYTTILKAQMELRGNKYLGAPLRNSEDLADFNFTQGEISAFTVSIGMPEALVEALAMDIEELEKNDDSEFESDTE